jgi:phage terminase small subunit
MTERRPSAQSAAAKQRRELFVQAYLAPGDHQHDQTHAAIAAGFSAKTARSIGGRLIKEAGVAEMIAEAARKVAAKVELSTERTLREVGEIAYNDSRRFFHPDGSLKMPVDWDDAMAACVASVEMGAEVVGKGKAARIAPYVKKIKWWNKLDAADKIMRHQGLFEKDNRQKQENLAIQINLVGGPEPRATNGSGVTVKANLIGPNGKNGSHP